MHSQVWVTTHAEPLAQAIAKRSRVEPVRLTKQLGATVVEGGSRAPEE
jgi:predicted ATPase